MNEITKKFVDLKLPLNVFCKQVGIDLDQLIDILHKDGYLYAKKGAITEKIINLKNAADEYVKNDSVYIEELCKKYNISHTTLPKYLKEYLGISIKHRHKAKFNDTIFDTIDTEEKAYWLGFLFADGSVDSSPLREGVKSKHVIELSLKLEDLNHLQKFANMLGVSVIYDNYRCRCIVCSLHLWKRLTDIGCVPNKSLTLKFPNLSIFSKKTLVVPFLRGYFDGDGCVSYYNKTHTILNIQVLGTEEFLKSFLQLCPKDLKDLTLRHNHNNINESTMFFNTSHNKAVTFLNFIYTNATIFLERKYNRYFAHINGDINNAESKIGKSCDANPELIS